MNKLPLSYAEATLELEAILQEIEDDATDIDVLTEKVKRAALLVKFCKEKLRNAEGAIDQALKELDNETE